MENLNKINPFQERNGPIAPSLKFLQSHEWKKKILSNDYKT